MHSDQSQQFDKLTPKTYAFGAAIVAIGVFGVYMMIAKPDVHPTWTVFFYSIPSNIAISVFPHEPVLIWYGKSVNVWNLSLAAVLGTLVAAWLDYKFFAPILNLSYSAKYKASKSYKKGHYWFYKAPFATLVAAGFLPVPFFVFKFIVCASKYPFWKYLAAVAVGRFPRYMILALVGQVLQVPDWLIFAVFGAVIIILYHKKIIEWISWPFTAKRRHTENMPPSEERK